MSCSDDVILDSSYTTDVLKVTSRYANISTVCASDK